MKMFGCTSSPLEFCEWLNSSGLDYSVNEVTDARITIFDSVFNLLKCISNKTIKNHYVLVFDCKEKLRMVEEFKDEPLVNSKHLHELKIYLKLKGSADGTVAVSYKERNYINETIEENKNSGIMHTYNTLIYKIKTKDLRDKLVQLILKYSAGKISFEQISKFTQDIKAIRRNEATKATIEAISQFIQSEEFGRIRKSLIELLKLSKKPTNQAIETVALKNNVEPYDVRYLFHVINK